MISLFEISVRLGCALVLSGIVGLEREYSESSAGLRTHAMVGLGSALFALVSVFGFGDAVNMPHASFDPSRVSSLVVSGIGFLCAGAIINSRGNVRGLTTASSLWTCAAIGLASGSGMFLAAAFTTAGVIFLLFVIGAAEKKWLQGHRGLWITARVSPPGSVGALVMGAEKVAPVREVRIASSGEHGQTVHLRFDLRKTGDHKKTIVALSDVPGIDHVELLD